MYGITSSNQMSSMQGSCVTIWLLCVLWSTCTSVSAAARPLRYTNPVFLDTPVNITVDSGQEAIIPCAVENLGPKSVIWKKVSQQHPITIGEYVFAPDSRYFLKRRRTQIANPEWNLHIRDVQPIHAGMYQCQISAKEEIGRLVSLNVRDTGKKPKSGIRLMGTSFVEKGMTIKLNCTASAKDYSPQGVDWFKDGLKLRANERIAISSTLIRKDNTVHSKLEIKRSNMSDAGTYVCRSSQYHIASLKVIVLNAETTNVKRGTFPNYNGEIEKNPKPAISVRSEGGESGGHRSTTKSNTCLSISFTLTLLVVTWATARTSWDR